MICLHNGAKTKVKVKTPMFEKFKVSVGVYQEIVLSPLLFATVTDIDQYGMIWDNRGHKIMHTDHLVLILEF